MFTLRGTADALRFDLGCYTEKVTLCFKYLFLLDATYKKYLLTIMLKLYSIAKDLLRFYTLKIKCLQSNIDCFTCSNY